MDFGRLNGYIPRPMKMWIERIAAVVLGLAAVMIMAGVYGCGNTEEARLDAGMIQLRQGELVTAIELFEKVLEKNPDSATAHCNIGLALWKQGRLDKALVSLKKAADLSETDPRPLEFMGLIFDEQKSYESARKSFDQALQRAPKSARIFTEKGVMELRADNMQGALSSLMKAFAADSAYPPALYNLAVIYRDHLNNLEKAAVFFDRYLKVAGNDRHSKAAADFMQPPDPENSPARELLIEGRAAMGREEFDKALEMLKKAISKDPSNPAALWDLAVLYDKHLEFPEKAIQIYGKFKQTFPGDPRSARVQRNIERLESAKAQQAKPVHVEGRQSGTR